MFALWRERLRERWYGGYRAAFNRWDGCMYAVGFLNYGWRVNGKCFVLNIIDFRYWRCPCAYVPPYGKVISADCAKHD